MSASWLTKVPFIGRVIAVAQRRNRRLGADQIVSISAVRLRAVVHAVEAAGLRVRLRLANVLLRQARELTGIADESLPVEIARGRGREKDRWTYQRQWVPFDIRPGERVLDIGSGNDPFPQATHLADMYGEDNAHRGGGAVALTRDKRPLVYSDIEVLPFPTGSFDFVYCSHVLEHVVDPVAACREIVRIGRRGYIETPTRLSDIMFNFTRLRHHRWHVSAVAGTMVFIQYTEREYRDTGTSAFYMQFQSPWTNAFQELVHRNRDLFVNMVPWVGGVRVVVIDHEGRLVANETVGTPGGRPDAT